jgi:hypothetical protein
MQIYVSSGNLERRAASEHLFANQKCQFLYVLGTPWDRKCWYICWPGGGISSSITEVPGAIDIGWQLFSNVDIFHGQSLFLGPFGKCLTFSGNPGRRQKV